jgi:transcriptional adapter 2-alpha
MGKVGNTHKADHPYRVLDALDFPLFEEGWCADEELILVEGLETYGIGNWEQIAELMGTKTKEQCAYHYKRVFIDSDAWPEPVDTLPDDFDRFLYF